MARSLKNSDPWLEDPDGVPLALVLSIAVKGKVKGFDAHKTFSQPEINQAYLDIENSIENGNFRCAVTNVILEPYSGTGLNKISPDRLHSDLAVDSPHQTIQRVSYFFNK